MVDLPERTFRAALIDAGGDIALKQPQAPYAQVFRDSDSTLRMQVAAGVARRTLARPVLRRVLNSTARMLLRLEHLTPCGNQDGCRPKNAHAVAEKGHLVFRIGGHPGIVNIALKGPRTG